MSTLDSEQSLKNSVENKTKEFLDHYGQADKFADLQRKANEALMNFGVSEHFNAYTNGAVEAVASETGKTEDEIRDAFRKYYYSGKFE